MAKKTGNKISDQSEALLDWAEKHDVHWSTILMTGAILMGFDMQGSKRKAFKRELADWQKLVNVYANECFEKKD